MRCFREGECSGGGVEVSDTVRDEAAIGGVDEDRIPDLGVFDRAEDRSPDVCGTVADWGLCTVVEVVCCGCGVIGEDSFDESAVRHG